MCDFYIYASNVIDKLILKKGSIKGLTYRDDNKTSKTSYALVCETLKYKDIIDELIAATKGIEKEKNIKYSLLLVMIYELLFSANKSIKGGGIAKKVLMNYKTQLSSALARMKVKNKVVEDKDLLPEHIKNPVILPRYVRINTLKSKDQSKLPQFIQSTIETFKSEGYEFLDKLPVPSIADLKLSEKQFCQDPDFKEILIFHSQIDLHDHKLLLSGDIILQDKASCLPSYVLNPPENATCIDSCSAPGNKTSLLSAIMKNTGKIFAIEKDKTRLNTLIKLTTRSNCKNIETINDSFLNLKWDDPKFENVEYILCDPSCSGSGIVNRLDYLLPTKGSDNLENIEEPMEIESTTNPTKPTNNNNNNKNTNNIDNINSKKRKKPMKSSKKEQQVSAQELEQKEKQLKEEQEIQAEKKRNQQLADFQLSIIRHAFGFPNVKKVAYSTCSIHQVENEDVVKRALEELNPPGSPPTWELVNILPNWKDSRGFSDVCPNSSFTVRMSPQKDKTIGFYVALFQKLPQSNSTLKPVSKVETKLQPKSSETDKVKETNMNTNIEKPKSILKPTKQSKKRELEEDNNNNDDDEKIESENVKESTKDYVPEFDIEGKQKPVDLFSQFKGVKIGSSSNNVGANTTATTPLQKEQKNKSKTPLKKLKTQ
ncbi:NOL1/NOP2/Sun family protein [Tieghemostelium lacteum]|uniref:NOL1/NOP2/Sun family protein n=1 Tax=Tieghemostelium lacteum TaxID=361077 RepID=A0A151Z619_TIELA|nr:NOL1/NOP2/Sun family protein [Tieghemostelium lacteum]|eukprot:KYQ89378.1 NOL1/NOP2/Sun family protein [Tieghemostelium lacteum]